MTPETFSKKMDAALHHAKRNGFRQWIESSEVKVVLSIMPASPHLEAILRAAFESGVDNGAGGAMAMFVTEAINLDPRFNK